MVCRNRVILIEDDIQGTGCVTQAAIKAAVWVAKGKIADQRVVIFGAGTAGTGIADQLRDMMVLEGKSKEEATKQIWCVITEAIAEIKVCGQTRFAYEALWR